MNRARSGEEAPLTSIDAVASRRWDTVDAEVLRDRFRLSDEDLERVRTVGESIAPLTPQLLQTFQTWLEGTPEYEEIIPDDETARRFGEALQDHWELFFSATISADYIAGRAELGDMYAELGASLGLLISAADYLQSELFSVLPGSSEERDQTRSVIARLIHLDLSIIIESYERAGVNRATAQARALLESSTPVTQLWDGILMLPVVGIIDSRRAQDIMDAMLSSIARTEARNFILDISGVPVVDTAVANHLIMVTQATTLMGCHTIISGISPAIAQTVVDLGIDVRSVETTAAMRDALSLSFARRGVKLVSGEATSARS
jgi:rsbT co-antagonist protein RsbR